MMDVSKEFHELTGFTARRLVHLPLGILFGLTSRALLVAHYVLRFEVIRKLQRKAHRMSRDNLASYFRLPRVTHYDVAVISSQIKVPGEDVVLNGDVFLPVEAKEGKIQVPAVLIRTPYDRNRPVLGPTFAWFIAERGYACLMQDTRGRFGSGGEFFPMGHEVKDGTTSVEWLRTQPWCNGKVGTHGDSYLGLTAYAATGGEQVVDAICPVMASSRLYPILYHGGSTINFDLVIRWLWLVLDVWHQKNPFKKLHAMLRPNEHLEHVFRPVGTKPMHHRDLDIAGQELDFYRQVMESHELDAEFWKGRDMLCDLSRVAPPMTIVAGWHDMFVQQSFKDFLIASNVQTCVPLTLISGPWNHHQFPLFIPVGLKAAFDLFEVYLKGDKQQYLDDSWIIEKEGGKRPTRVIVHVLHSHSESHELPSGRWLQFPTWPPVMHTLPKQLFLADDGKLAAHPPLNGGKGFTEQVYDPQNPAPNYGGPSFDWVNAGPIPQNELEGRDDVLTFTTNPFTEPVTIVGEVTMKLFLWSSNPHTDVFVKVCDVDGRTKKSINVIEKMTRLSLKSHKWDADGNVEIDIDVGSIAVKFKQCNSLRIQVSGAAHPLYLRHNGMHNHLLMEMQPALRKIKHSPEHPSVITLPVIRGNIGI